MDSQLSNLTSYGDYTGCPYIMYSQLSNLLEGDYTDCPSIKDSHWSNLTYTVTTLAARISKTVT